LTAVVFDGVCQDGWLQSEMCRRGNGLAAESQVEDFDRDPTMWLGAQSGR